MFYKSLRICSFSIHTDFYQLSKIKRGNLSCIVNIVILATKLAKTVAKPIYSLVGDLHGILVGRSSSLLGSA